jgi:alkylation response protein AidB-like acyl-CoA dehydrogenase
MTTTAIRPSPNIAPDHPTDADLLRTAREIGIDLAPHASDHDRTGEISRPAFDRLRAAGLTAALVPIDHGGAGASHAGLGAVLRELGRHDPATAVTLSMHSHLVATQVWRHHHGADATGVFSKVVDGAILVSTGASDWVASNGSARRVDGGFRVSARKSPASGCEVGQILVTSIRWDDGPDGPQVIHCTIPCAADGVGIELTWDTLGLRATGSHTVVLDDVFGAAMPLIMSAYVGIADAAVDLATAAVMGRDEPHVLQLVGEMLDAHTTGADVVDAMLAASDDLRFDNTDMHASRTLARKSVAADALIRTVRLAIETTGGFGYTRSSELERLYRDVHGCLFHPLPRAKQTRFSGRVALGLSPFG